MCISTKYAIEAISKTPAFIIYLLDVSALMRTNMGGKQRIDVVEESLQTAFQQMVLLDSPDACGILSAIDL